MVSLREFIKLKIQLNDTVGLKRDYHNVYRLHRQGSSMMAIAVDLGCSAEVLRFMIHEGIGSINAKYEGRTALYLAVHYQRADLVKILLQSGGIVEKKCGTLDTPPIVLAAQKDVRILKMLLQHDPHQMINGTDKNGVTALRSAAKYGNLETARVLLAYGADPTLADHVEKRTPLFICRSNDDFPKWLNNQNDTVVKIMQKRRQIARLLEEEDRAYLVYKGFLLRHARVVAENDYKRDLFSILHLPEVVKKRICRRQILPRVLYTAQAQGLRAHPEDKVEVWIEQQNTTKIQDVVHEVWGMKQDTFRELMGFLL